MRPFAVCLWVVAWSIAGTAAPSITGLDWNPIDAGGPYFPLTITGAGFVNGSIAYWGQTTLTTTHVNSTQLIAEISPDLRLIAGNYFLTVANPDGSVSKQYAITVSPVANSVSPGAVVAGSKALTVTIKGIGFQSRLVAQISTSTGTLNLTTTLVDSATLTAVIPASALADARTASIQVIDPLYGGSSGTVPFAVHGSPVISTATPNPIDAGGGYFLLNVTGSGFAPGVVVDWANGVGLSTNYMSPTQVQAAITPELRTLAGAFPLTVVDPATGAASGIYSLIVAPVLFGVSPSAAATGSPAATITASGAGFTSSTTLSMTVAGKVTPLATTYVSANTLTGVIPANALASSGSLSIQVNDAAGGGHSLAVTFPVSPSIPVVTGLAPSGAMAGAAAFSMTVTGSAFASGAVVLWNGTPLATTFGSASQLTAAVPAALLQIAGTVSVAVSNAGGVPSAAATFTIHSPPPVLSAIAPSAAIAGSAAFTLTVTATNCGTGCVAQWNGSPLATSPVSSSQVAAVVPASLVAYAGTASIRLVNSDGAASSAATFLIDPPAATLTIVTPNPFTAGTAPVALTVNGINFAAGATVLWNGSPLATTFVSTTQLTATVAANQFSGLLSAAVSVSNPGGAVSNNITVTIAAPRPTIALISPASVAAGGGSFLLTLTGQNFAVNCVVRWNGTPLYTTLNSSTQASANVTADLIASPGTANITLANPSGLESSASTLTISTPAPSIDSISPSSAAAGVPGMTLTIMGGSFLAASKVLWNGSALATTFVSGTQLKADVPALLLAAPGLVSVAVSSPGVTPANAAVFTIGDPAPTTTTAGIANVASSQSAIAPGSLISIYGVNLAPSAAAAISLPLPLSLNGTSVTINGIDAPLEFVSGGQINAQVPFEVAPGSTSLSIRAGALKSSPVSFAVQAVAPGVLPVVQNCLDGSVNSAQSPVQVGQFITLWVTGQGPIDTPIATGEAAPADPIALPLAAIRAQIGGQDAQVVFAGMAPGLAGLMQVNLVVPTTAAGQQPVVVKVGEVVSNQVMISVAGQ